MSISYPTLTDKEIEDLQSDTFPIDDIHSGNETEIFFRFGIGYDYNLKDVHPEFMILPHVKFDFIDDQVVMGAGVAFGINFDLNF